MTKRNQLLASLAAILLGWILYVLPNDWSPVFLLPALALQWIGAIALIASYFRKGSFR